MTALWNNPSQRSLQRAAAPIASVAAVASARESSTGQARPMEGGNASFSGQSLVSSLQPQMMSRVVRAPPGKLAIVIDTTLEGPVAHEVTENSPLVGLIFPGDLISAINNVDTRAMSLAAITSLIAWTAHKSRKLTVLSRDFTDGDQASSPFMRRASTARSIEEWSVAEATESTLRTDMGSRIVNVPPGRLGLVIDTADDGPIVNQVKPDSKLKGLVFEGDVIAAVNDVDTTKFSGQELTDLFARTSNTTRRIKVLSRDVTDVTSAQLKPKQIVAASVPLSDEQKQVVAGVTSLSAASTVTSTLRSEMSTRIVKAPPGRLGLVIDTTVDGPVIKTVKDDSPLRGLVFEQDLIAAVDGVDTRAMSGIALTSLIGSTSLKTRRLTVVTQDVSDAESVGSWQRSLASSIVERSTSQSTVDRSDIGVRTIEAPPGRLGIILDTTADGPVVQNVKDDSRLRGLIFEGDVIVAVNDIDTTAMSSADLTSLVARTSNITRRLRVASRDVSDIVRENASKAAEFSRGTDVPLSLLQVSNQDQSSTTLGTTSEEESPQPVGVVSRSVAAPPGKLGISVDPTPNGPTIKEVKAGSPLEGVVFEGEIITTINDVDITTMSGAELISLVARTSTAPRELVVMSSPSEQPPMSDMQEDTPSQLVSSNSLEPVPEKDDTEAAVAPGAAALAAAILSASLSDSNSRSIATDVK